MKSIDDLTRKAEAYFQELDKDKDAAQQADNYIMDTLNHALPVQDSDLLLSLIPYIENEEGSLSRKYTGETY